MLWSQWIPDLTIRGAKRGAGNTEFGNIRFFIVVVWFALPKAYRKETENQRHIQEGRWKGKTRYQGQ